MLEEHIGGCHALAVVLWEKVNAGVEEGLVDRNIPTSYASNTHATNTTFIKLVKSYILMLLLLFY